MDRCGTMIRRKNSRKEHISHGEMCGAKDMSEQKNPKMFKTVFGGGYQKSDVNEYIESMQAEFISIEQTLKNTINHQSAELDSLRAAAAEADGAREKAEQLQCALDGTAEKLGQVSEELERMKTDCIAAEAGRATAEASAAAGREQVAALTAERDAANEALAALRAQYEQLLCEQEALKNTVSTVTAEKEQAAEAAKEAMAAMQTPTEPTLPADYESLKLKAEQYDRMSAHIGAIMLKANAGAEEVMRSAKADAEAMLARVNETLAQTRVRAQNSADHLIEDLSRSLGEISRGCRDDIAMDLEEIRAALRTLEDAVESKYEDISRKLDYTKEEMGQTADAIIQSATTPVTLPTDHA